MRPLSRRRDWGFLLTEFVYIWSRLADTSRWADEVTVTQHKVEPIESLKAWKIHGGNNYS